VATRFEAEFLDGSALDDWDALAAAAPGATAFHRAGWLRLVARAYGRAPRVVGVVRNGALVGGSPVYERTVFGMRIAAPPVVAGYAGVLVHLPEYRRAGRAHSEVEQILEAVEEALRRRYAYARLVNDPSLGDGRAFQWRGWRVVPRFTYRLPLGDPDAMLAAFEHNARKQVRKALDAGLTVHRAESADEVLGTYAASYRRHRLASPVSADLLRRVVADVLASGLGRAYVQRDGEGRARAFRIILTNGPHACEWIAGSDSDSLSQGGASLLVWRILSDLSGTHGEYDFMGANTPSIARFKRAFGGELAVYFEATRATPIAAALLAARRLARR
jgi:hypothetical protein